ncbi:MAG: type II CRISPR-associated endonuclease Cas1 [Bacteroidetes bacterium]|jgi:CRISPR-associated protein Cas1|nr:type II CRISPR-associated endonuclease Cas1 [Bacteroidota bacterium]
MIKRTVEISSGPVHLSIKHKQMLLKKDGDIHSIPVEDLGLLVLSHPAISYTHQLLYELLEQNVAVLFCNRQHMPEGLLLPFEDNQLYQARLQSQTVATKPLKKRLWQQVVRAKIKAQAQVLENKHGDHGGLKPLIKRVHSGDPKNVEARAARKYWKALFQNDEFRRNTDGQDINALLNYGYAVIRAAVARSITAAGLHPSIGIHHHNQYNAYCLADDMMEPLRPFVDSIVYDIYDENGTLKVEVNKETKKPLLELLTKEVMIKEMNYPLLESLHLMASSLVDCFTGDAKKVAFPIDS